MNADKIKENLNKKYKEIFNTFIAEINEKCCDCFDECLGSVVRFDTESEGELLHNGHSFWGNYNAHIGTHYGADESIPKIVFLGKENTKKDITVIDTVDFKDKNAQNQHYTRTRAILATLLKITDKIDENNKIYECDQNGKNYALHTLFALTNHYHCAFKRNTKRHGISCTNKMWYNCTKIVKAELEILDPDILVIQAGWSTKQGAKKDIMEYFDNGKYSVEADAEVAGLYWLIERTKEEKKCCIIGSYHPSFHSWHQAKYLEPLNERIKEAKKWFDTKENN